MALEITLSFDGASADDNVLDLYDGAQALVGFQRSLAITTHLIVNGEVITQAPSLKNAQILSYHLKRAAGKQPLLLQLPSSRLAQPQRIAPSGT